MAADDLRVENLEQLKKRGRAALEAKEAQRLAKEQAAERSLAKERRKFAELRTWSTWRSITPWGHVWFFGIILFFGGPCIALAPILITNTITPDQGIAYLACAALVLCVARLVIALARRRVFAFVQSQPFPLLGYEASMHHYGGNGRGGPQRIELRLAFARSRPHGAALLEAISGARTSGALRGDEPLKITLEEDGFEITLEGGSTLQGHRRWFARYMPGLCEVLRVVHTTHPIAFLRVDATP